VCVRGVRMHEYAHVCTIADACAMHAHDWGLCVM